MNKYFLWAASAWLLWLFLRDSKVKAAVKEAYPGEAIVGDPSVATLLPTVNKLWEGTTYYGENSNLVQRL